MKYLHHGSGQDEFHQRGDAERKAPPIAHRHVGGDEIVPAEPVKIGRDAPVRSPGIDRPACHRPVGRQLRRRNLALHVPGFLEPRHFADEAAMLMFRSDRLVAGHLHEATLAHERCSALADSWPLAGSLGNMAWPIKRGGRSPARAVWHRRDKLLAARAQIGFSGGGLTAVSAVAAAAVELDRHPSLYGAFTIEGPERDRACSRRAGPALIPADQKSTPDVHHVR